MYVYAVICTLCSFMVIVSLCRRTHVAKTRSCSSQTGTKTLIVLGSGGHTAEMLALLSRMDALRYHPRSYVVAATDRMGAAKAQSFEESFSRAKGCGGATVNTCSIPRSREVAQSYVTSLWTTLVALQAAFVLVLQQKPDLVLVNGPGTCIPICLAAFIFRYIQPWRGQIVYVESIARVKSLSLSGKILYLMRIADLFFVQWPELQRLHNRARICGRLY